MFDFDEQDDHQASKFSNCRDWHSFVTAAQAAAVAYPKAATAGVATAFEAGHAWFTQNSAIADCLWGDLLARRGKTLGI